MRRLALFLLLASGGCQCFVPVSEDPDAGSDGGSDAGVSKDAGPECTGASQCVPMSAPRTCGFAASSPSRSCFDGRCVYDCAGARTCTTKLGSCLSCDGGVPSCNAASCNFVNDGDTGRVYRSCVAGSSEQVGTFLVRYAQGATCNFRVLLADGGVFGALELLGDFESGTAQVSEEPGVTCTVRGLATALNRVELGCARCLYLLEWP